MKSSWILRPGASEFPHENTLIDRGALWIGSALCDVELAVPERKKAKARTFARLQALAPPMLTEPTLTEPTLTESARTDPILPPPPDLPLSSEVTSARGGHAEPAEPRAEGAQALAPMRTEPILPPPPDPPARTEQILPPPLDSTLSSPSAPTPRAELAEPGVSRVEPVPPRTDPAARGTERVAAQPGPSDQTAPQDERVETFVRAITEVARAHGPAETAAHVESLFKFGTPAPLDLNPSAKAALLDGNILEATDTGVHATAWFTRTSSAWQSLLRGDGGSLAECGESTLDDWTADLIARLVAKPGMASTIRRELRRRGIAAFGMLDS